MPINDDRRAKIETTALVLYGLFLIATIVVAALWGRAG